MKTFEMLTQWGFGLFFLAGGIMAVAGAMCMVYIVAELLLDLKRKRADERLK